MLKTVIDGIMCKSFHTDYILKVFIIVSFCRKAGLHVLYVAETSNMPLSLALLLLFSPCNITKNFRYYPHVSSPVLPLCVIDISFYVVNCPLGLYFSEYLESSA